MKSLRGRRDDLEGFGKRGGENGFRGKRFLDAATMNSRSRSCGNSVASLTLTVQQVCSLKHTNTRPASWSDVSSRTKSHYHHARDEARSPRRSERACHCSDTLQSTVGFQKTMPHEGPQTLVDCRPEKSSGKENRPSAHLRLQGSPHGRIRRIHPFRAGVRAEDDGERLHMRRDRYRLPNESRSQLWLVRRRTPPCR